MNIAKKLLLISISITILISCKSLPKAEEEIMNDATAPAGYNPVFIQSVKPFDPDNINNPSVVISGVDARRPNAVKVRIHLIDSNKTILTGAAGSKYRYIWCFLADSFGTGQKNIKKYKLKEVTEEDKEPVAIALVADHSGSMGDWRADAVQKSIDYLIRTKKDEDAFSIVKYDNKTVLEAALTTSKEELSKNFKMDKLSGYGGMTAISNGIMEGINSLKSAPFTTQKAVIVFTDGWDNSSSVKKDSIINLSKTLNIPIFAVDFGVDINKGYMQEFADKSGGYYQHIYSTDEFKLVFNDIYKRLKNSYTLEYNPDEYGVHKLQIKICLPKDSLAAEEHFDNTPDLGSIGLLNIYFDFDKASIKKESSDDLNSIFNLMKGFPNMEIEIRGHTDSQNSGKDTNYNLKLSQKRADAVKSVLVRKGISESRISAKGFGESVPIADNTTEEGRALNRRTEFVVLKK